MSFAEITSRLTEHKVVLEALRRWQVDFVTIGKIENMMVRDVLIVAYTTYQRYVVAAVLQKADRHSNHPSLVNFFREKIEKTNIDLDTLTSVLRMMQPQYASNFGLIRKNMVNLAIITAYTNIVEERHLVAHEQGDGVQFGSLDEIEQAHNQAKHLLESFASCMF